MNDAILADIPDYQAVFLWEYVHFLNELFDYALNSGGSIDAGTLHGFTSRIMALRDDLADELPPDPRMLAPGRPLVRFPPKPPGGGRSD
jgi:hypothetical protein